MTVDWDQVDEFVKGFKPSIGMLLIQIAWKETAGGVFYIPLNVQQIIFEEIGRENYFKKPTRKTNPRGVEYSQFTIQKLLEHKDTKKIEITWNRSDTNIDIYKKWENHCKSD